MTKSLQMPVIRVIIPTHNGDALIGGPDASSNSHIARWN